MILWTQVFTFGVRGASFLAFCVWLDRMGAGLPGVILMGIFAGIWTLCGWLDWRG